VAHWLYHRYGGQRLAAMTTAGVLVRAPGGRLVAGGGASTADARLLAALEAVRGRLIRPEDIHAKAGAEATLAAVSDLEAQVTRLTFDLTRAGGSPVLAR
jgi:hypothetical protein